MLRNLLTALKEGKTQSIQEIAKIINADTEIVSAQIDYLERNGYIKRVVLYAGCGHNCSHCSGGCNNASRMSMPVMWELAKQ